MTPLDLAFVVLAVAVVPAVWRGLRGPGDGDRAAAADLVFFIFVAVVALLAVRRGDDAYFDVAVVGTLLGFLASVALARLVHRGGA